MIFVTVGTQVPFDRLVRGVDAWASARGRRDVFAQTGASAWRPAHIEHAPFLDPEDFRRRFDAADAIVAHAGMGSIITALEMGKPILVMPRLSSLGEHRNDHQVATAKRFLELGSVAVAFEEAELAARLDGLGSLEGGRRIGATASPRLLAVLREFIHQGKDHT